MKNIVIGILSIVSVGSIAYGYMQRSTLDHVQATCELEKNTLEKFAQEQQLQAREFQKMAELAQQEAIVQRTICEEQLKALKK
jgi:Tfp pilus assembly protein PilE